MNSIVALPIIAAVPTTAPAMTTPSVDVADPAYAAIDTHRKSRKIVKAALLHLKQLLERADVEAGPAEISVLDMREPSNPLGWHPYVDALTSIDIDKYVPPEANLELNTHYREKLDQRQAARNAFLVDADDIVSDEMCSADCDAATGLAEVVPTTVPGLLALLAYLGSAHREPELFSEEDYSQVFRSLAKSAKGLLRQPREKLVLAHDSASTWPEGLATSMDSELSAASCELQVCDLAIDGLHGKFGDDADSRDDYQEISSRRFEILDILASTPAESWLGVQAKASALRRENTLADYRVTTEIAESLADDIVIRCCEPPACIAPV